MSKKRRHHGARTISETLSLEEAASKLGVSVEALLEAMEDSGVMTEGRREELRLEAAEVASFGRQIEQGRAKVKGRLAGLKRELDD